MSALAKAGGWVGQSKGFIGFIGSGKSHPVCPVVAIISNSNSSYSFLGVYYVLGT